MLNIKCSNVFQFNNLQCYTMQLLKKIDLLLFGELFHTTHLFFEGICRQAKLSEKLLISIFLVV